MSEARIQAEIEVALGAEADLLLMRNNVGLATYDRLDERTGKVKTYKVAYGLRPGSPDLVGILRAPDGRGCWFCLEIKDEGEGATPEQLKCHAMWRTFGAFVEVVDSVAKARAALGRARARLRGEAL